jgi:hypothetical protein
VVRREVRAQRLCAREAPEQRTQRAAPPAQRLDVRRAARLAVLDIQRDIDGRLWHRRSGEGAREEGHARAVQREHERADDRFEWREPYGWGCSIRALRAESFDRSAGWVQWGTSR